MFNYLVKRYFKMAKLFLLNTYFIQSRKGIISSTYTGTPAHRGEEEPGFYWGSHCTPEESEFFSRLTLKIETLVSKSPGCAYVGRNTDFHSQSTYVVHGSSSVFPHTSFSYFFFYVL